MEDEYSVARMYELILKFHGFQQCTIVRNGQEAVNFYKKCEIKPDIILMDYRMPIKNGVDASREILDYDKNAKIIFTTADDSILEKISKLGIVTIKIKPFDNVILIKNIKKALNSHFHHE